MHRRNRAKSSSLFLLELILAILFFSVASAVCIQLFVKSHLLSRDAELLNHAVAECSGIAELITVSEDMAGAMDALCKLYPDALRKEQQVLLYYNEAFEACPPGAESTVLTVDFRQENQMLVASLTLREASGEADIYSLSVTHHLQRRPGNA